MAKRHERTLARRQAVQVLYSAEITNARPSDAAADDAQVLADGEEGPLLDYGLQLVRGVQENQAEIDSYLTSTSENWSLLRMPLVDRSILRLAVYEMLCEHTVPVSVTINEAVELAKDFGGEDESPRFVNGVLGRIARKIEEGDAVADASAGSEGDEGRDASEGEPDGSADAASDTTNAGDAASFANTTTNSASQGSGAE